jgi:hypothetical protein
VHHQCAVKLNQHFNKQIYSNYKPCTNFDKYEQFGGECPFCKQNIEVGNHITLINSDSNFKLSRQEAAEAGSERIRKREQIERDQDQARKAAEETDKRSREVFETDGSQQKTTISRSQKIKNRTATPKPRARKSSISTEASKRVRSQSRRRVHFNDAAGGGNLYPDLQHPNNIC